VTARPESAKKKKVSSPNDHFFKVSLLIRGTRKKGGRKRGNHHKGAVKSNFVGDVGGQDLGLERGDRLKEQKGGWVKKKSRISRLPLVLRPTSAGAQKTLFPWGGKGRRTKPGGEGGGRLRKIKIIKN